MSISQRAAAAMRTAIVWDNTFPFAAPCGTYTAHVKTLDRMRAVGYTCASLTVCADFDDMPSAMRKLAHDLARFRETEERFIVVRTVAHVGQAKLSDTQPQLDVIAESAWRFPASQYTLTEIPQVAPEQIPELAEIMLRHGHSDAVVSGVLGGNWLRVAHTVWK